MAAPREASAQIARLSEVGTSHILRLDPNLKQEWIVGRRSDTDFKILGPYVSRRQCSIRYVEKNYYISDLKSSNGTYIKNCRLLTGPYLLHDGDVIIAGGLAIADDPTFAEEDQRFIEFTLVEDDDDCLEIYPEAATEQPALLLDQKEDDDEIVVLYESALRAPASATSGCNPAEPNDVALNKSPGRRPSLNDGESSVSSQSAAAGIDFVRNDLASIHITPVNGEDLIANSCASAQFTAADDEDLFADDLVGRKLTNENSVHNDVADYQPLSQSSDLVEGVVSTDHVVPSLPTGVVSSSVSSVSGTIPYPSNICKTPPDRNSSVSSDLTARSGFSTTLVSGNSSTLITCTRRKSASSDDLDDHPPATASDVSPLSLDRSITINSDSLADNSTILVARDSSPPTTSTRRKSVSSDDLDDHPPSTASDVSPLSLDRSITINSDSLADNSTILVARDSSPPTTSTRRMSASSDELDDLPSSSIPKFSDSFANNTDVVPTHSPSQVSSVTASSILLAEDSSPQTTSTRRMSSNSNEISKRSSPAASHGALRSLDSSSTSASCNSFDLFGDAIPTPSLDDPVSRKSPRSGVSNNANYSIHSHLDQFNTSSQKPTSQLMANETEDDSDMAAEDPGPINIKTEPRFSWPNEIITIQLDDEEENIDPSQRIIDISDEEDDNYADGFDNYADVVPSAEVKSEVEFEPDEEERETLTQQIRESLVHHEESYPAAAATTVHSYSISERLKIYDDLEDELLSQRSTDELTAVSTEANDDSGASLQTHLLSPIRTEASSPIPNANSFSNDVLHSRTELITLKPVDERPREIAAEVFYDDNEEHGTVSTRSELLAVSHDKPADHCETSKPPPSPTQRITAVDSSTKRCIKFISPEECPEPRISRKRHKENNPTPKVKSKRRKTAKNGADNFTLTPVTKSKIKMNRKVRLKEIALKTATKVTEPMKKSAPLKVKGVKKSRNEILWDLGTPPPAVVNEELVTNKRPRLLDLSLSAMEVVDPLVSAECDQLSKDIEEMNQKNLPRKVPTVNSSSITPAPKSSLKSCLKIMHSSVHSNRTKKSVSFNSGHHTQMYQIEEGSNLKPTKSARHERKNPDERFHDYLKFVLSWNAAWLQECFIVRPLKLPPSLSELQPRMLEAKFRSVEHYWSSYKPFLFLELWLEIEAYWKCFHKKANIFPIAVEKNSGPDWRGLLTVDCQAMVEPGCIATDDLVLLAVKVEPGKVYPGQINSDKTKTVGRQKFAIVKSCQQISDYSPSDVSFTLRSKCSEAKRRLFKLKLVLDDRIKSDDNQWTQIIVVYPRFFKNLRSAKAIAYLDKSPLSQMIFKPRLRMTLPKAIDGIELHLNEQSSVHLLREIFVRCLQLPIQEQRDIVTRLVLGCEEPQPLLAQVSGIARSGKTWLLLSTVESLLRRRAVQCRFIITTSYDLYTDELMLRFKSRQLPGIRSVRFVPHRWEEAGSADVIFCTNFDCGDENLIKEMKKSSKRLIVLMDEATRAREPEGIIPTLLPTSHLILFGDVSMRPSPPYSEEGKQLHLKRSLLTRIFHELRGQKENHGKREDLILELSHQWRMNPIISAAARQLRNAMGCYLPCSDPIPSHDNVGIHPCFALELLTSPSESLKQGANLALALAEVVAERSSAKMHILTGDAAMRDEIKKIKEAKRFACYPRQLSVFTAKEERGLSADVVVLVVPAVGSKLDELYIMTRARHSFVVIIYDSNQPTKSKRWDFLKKAIGSPPIMCQGEVTRTYLSTLV